MGLPFGWLADRWRRTWIVGIGAIVWSLATVASGLAKNFPQLFVARMSVGIGEATLSPCALSIIADSFPRERRGKPIAVYSTALVFGSSIAFLIGAFVLTWAQRAELPALPGIGSVAPWQMILILLGAAGILPALPFFLVREPPRPLAQTSDQDLSGSGIRDTLRYVGRHWKTYGSYVSLVCLMTILAYAGGWNPAMFSRTWGWPAEKYALINGIVTLPLGLTVYFLSGWIVDAWQQRGRHDAPLLMVIFGALLMTPGYALAPLMPNAVVAFIVLNTGGVGVSIITAVSGTALLNITPGAIKGQVVALYYMMISLTGLFLGPTTVGFLSQNLFGEERLNLAVASVPLLYGAIPLLLIPVTRRLYLRQLARLAGYG